MPELPGNAMAEALVESVRSAGKVLLDFFGQTTSVQQKENQHNVVCEADVTAEQCIISHIRARFPDHGMIAEESGYSPGASEFTWVIDPLDGTSNFVAGIPWFGIQVGILHGSSPVMAAIYLPACDTLYFGEKNRGVRRDGVRVSVTSETELRTVLCAFGMDASSSERRCRANIELLFRVARGVRNIRTTNSVVDFCYAIDGRFGGCVNLNTRIWDIVPLSLMLPEAGGHLKDLQGNPIVFCLDRDACQRNYEVVGASDVLLPQLMAVVRGGAQ